MPDVEVHRITLSTRVEETVRWLQERGQVVAVIDAPVREYQPPRGFDGGVMRSILGSTAVLFRSDGAPNESPRMVVAGNDLTCHEGQIHISVPKDLHS